MPETDNPAEIMQQLQLHCSILMNLGHGVLINWFSLCMQHWIAKLYEERGDQFFANNGLFRLTSLIEELFVGSPLAMKSP